MSVYIRGMEMPKDDMKNIMILADGRVFQFSGYGNPKLLGTAVPVPPHGRLGDLDELKAKGYALSALRIEKDNEDRLKGWRELVSFDEAPTIIPADKEE